LVGAVFLEGILGRTRAEFEAGDGESEREVFRASVTEHSFAPGA